MFSALNDGYCPQCLLDNKKNELLLNDLDFWECPECHLQCHTASMSILSIMRNRGEGHLSKETKASEWVKSYTLSRSDKEHFRKSDGSIFKNEQELRDFILNEVKDEPLK